MENLSAPAPPPADPPPAAPPTRATTILGRLSQAVREQNWFAVVLEVLIVIVGVVVGFQVTAWGQDRANRAKEQGYLRQFAADLLTSEQRLDREEPLLASSDRDAALLVQAFHTAEPPPLDSLRRWRRRAGYYRIPSVVTATADALVATGDLTLIRDDSLRSLIATYSTSGVDAFQIAADIQTGELRRAVHGLNEGMDKVEVEMSRRTNAERDSVARADPMSFFPEGARRLPFPIVVEDVLNDRQFYAHATTLLDARRDLRGTRKALRSYLSGLREFVEARTPSP